MLTEAHSNTFRDDWIFARVELLIYLLVSVNNLIAEYFATLNPFRVLL